MIELNEVHKKDGIHAHVSGLKTAMVTIKPVPTPGAPERYQVTTVRREKPPIGILKGSNRHTFRYSYNAAVDYALGYANRVAKEKREKEA